VSNYTTNPLTGQYYTDEEIKHIFAVHYSLHEYDLFLREYSSELAPGYRATNHSHQVKLDLRFQGSLVKASIRGLRTAAPPPKRGKVAGFSDASRRRMIELMLKMEHVKSRVFVTLTYGEIFPDEKRAKENLKAFFERIRRKWPAVPVSGVWRMEHQERGAPHFHIMFFNLPYWNKNEVQEIWGQIINQERPFTRIEFIRSWRGVMSYTAKYMTKNTKSGGESGGLDYVSYPHATGRIWGVFNRANLPLAALVHVVYPFVGKSFARFRDLACQVWPELRDRQHPGFSLYVKNALKWYTIWQEISDIPF